MTGNYGTFDIKHATNKDAIYLSSRLRKEDVEEIPKGYTAYQSLMEGLNNGATYTLFKDAVAIGMFGAVVKDNCCYIWMVGSDKMAGIRRELLKHGKYIANKVIGRYDFGVNYVWDGNKSSIRWLKYIGADFNGEATIDGKEFLKFKIYK